MPFSPPFLHEIPGRIEAKCEYPHLEVFRTMLVGYMRVSSDSDRQTTDLQRDALVTAGVDARHLFEDKASGARDDRPGLKKCLEYVKSGDTLVVWKLDRLGRSLTHLLTIVEGLRKGGVAFRSLTEGMDTTTPHGELLFHLFGALAQYERALTRERVQAGLAAAKRRGRHGGRPLAVEAEKLSAILAALESGTSKAAVCRNFGIPRSTLVDTLARAGWTGPGGVPRPKAPKKRK
jgi:DNA invertase Pin-like site-specific DNA recombinase